MKNIEKLTFQVYMKRNHLLLTAGLVFLLYGLGVVLDAIVPNTNVADYPRIREQMSDSELVRHFPPFIPSNATMVKFVCSSSFMQRGTYMQLRLQLPQNEIASLSEIYNAEEEHIFIGGNRSDHANEPNGVPTTYFYTNETDDRSFPNNYQILVLHAQPEGILGFEWKHGYSYGVAVSLEKSEIIYWAEDW